MEHLWLEFQTKIEDNFELIKSKFDGLTVSLESQNRIMDEIVREDIELKAKLVPTE